MLRKEVEPAGVHHDTSSQRKGAGGQRQSMEEPRERRGREKLSKV